MRYVRTVARRELRAFFDHPTAYVLVIAFLSLGLFLTFRTLYTQRFASLRPFFDLLPWLFAVFIPAVTMRTVSEERRTRTLEWLLAQPVTEVDIIAGKFVGNWLFVLATLAASIPTAIGLLLVSETDPGVLVAQYAGAALLAAQFVAVGLWASSATSNQITAFILATAVSLALIMIGLPIVQIGLPPALGGAVASLSVTAHFGNVARGVIDLRDALYFASSTAFFLLLAGVLMQRERLSHTRGAWRRLRLGTIAAAVIVVLLNVLGANLRGRLDLTRDRLYTLSPATRDVARALDDVVQIRLFVSDELPPEIQLNLRDVRDLLADLRSAAGGNLRVTELNPADDPDAETEASSLGIRAVDFNVLRETEIQVKRGWFGLAVLYADKRDVIGLITRTDDLEYRLASSLATLTADHKPRLALLSGHGMSDASAFPRFSQLLGDLYEITSIPAQPDSMALRPDSIDVLGLVAPTERVDPAVLDVVMDYLDGGGSVLLLIEPVQLSTAVQIPMAVAIDTGLEPLLERYGLALERGMLFDLQSFQTVGTGPASFLVRPYPFWPITFRAREHATIRNLENLSVGWAGAITVRDTVLAKPLWVTTEAAGVMRSDMINIDPAQFDLTAADSLAVRTLAVAVDPGAVGGTSGNETSGRAAASGAEADAGPPAGSGRLIVVADATFLEDRFINQNWRNALFAVNAVDWLAQDEALIRIRSKHRVPPTLTFESDLTANALKWGNLVGIPLLFALGGFVRISRRGRRATRSWGRIPLAADETESSGGGRHE